MSVGSLHRTRIMADGNGAQGACSLRRNCTRVEGDRAGDTGSLCRYFTVRICDRRRRNPWARNRGNLCCVIGQAVDKLAVGTRASCETNGGVPDIAAGGRVGCTTPPSNCHLPLQDVPGSRALGFLPGLWPAPRRIPGAAAGAQEVGEGRTPPRWPDAYVLAG